MTMSLAEEGQIGVDHLPVEDRRESAERALNYSYPRDLGRFVLARWSEIAPTEGERPAPDPATLELFLSTVYQASMLREEERPVRFRAILTAPASIAPDGRPPEQAQRLAFAHPRSFTPSELRRLSAAADERHFLIGVEPDDAGELRIWGLVGSGTWWLRDVQGGRRAGAPLPDAPMVLVDAPGSVSVHRGHSLLARLRAGRVSGWRADPFSSRWLPERFNEFRDGLVERHLSNAQRARESSGRMWAPLDGQLPREISQRMMKRVVSMLRSARHGATVVFVPEEHARQIGSESCVIDLKYALDDQQARFGFVDLVVDILDRLAELHGDRPGPVRWADFETSTDHVLATLDEALFETAHLIAGLASLDGAVVLSKRHELMGFGGMITGNLPEVPVVAWAKDLEGDEIVEESADSVGARHRSAYRLVGGVEGAVAIVISQDGGVRFIAQKEGRVVYWELD